MGDSLEARGSARRFEDWGTDALFTTCAWRPPVHARLAAVAGDATANHSRAVLAFVARPKQVSNDEEAKGLALAWRRPGDLIEACPAGIVIVAGGFTDPSQCEAYVARAVAALGWHGATLGLAIFPVHGDRVGVLIASASASLRRALEITSAADAAAAVRIEPGTLLPSLAPVLSRARVVPMISPRRPIRVEPRTDASRPVSWPA